MTPEIQPAQSIDQTPPAQQPLKKKQHRFLKSYLIIVIVFIVLVGLAWFVFSKPSLFFSEASSKVLPAQQEYGDLFLIIEHGQLGTVAHWWEIREQGIIYYIKVNKSEARSEDLYYKFNEAELTNEEYNTIKILAEKYIDKLPLEKSPCYSEGFYYSVKVDGRDIDDACLNLENYGDKDYEALMNVINEMVTSKDIFTIYSGLEGFWGNNFIHWRLEKEFSE